MDNIDSENIVTATEIIESADVEADLISEDGTSHNITVNVSNVCINADEIISADDIGDLEADGDMSQIEMIHDQSEQMTQSDEERDDIVIAEAVVVTQYSCKFCNRRFDTIDKVKNHYLQRHDKKSMSESRLTNNNTTDDDMKEEIKSDFIEAQESQSQDEAQEEVMIMPTAKKRGRPPGSTIDKRKKFTSNYRLRVVGNIKSEDANEKRKRGRKPSGIERKFPCDWPGCNYIARHSVHLKDHKRTHTGEKPYRCNWPDCGLGFVQGSALKTHLRTHTGEKPYPCEWPGCTLRFSQKNNVKIHMRTHTGEKPYACDWPGCEWRFAIKGNLDDHKRVHAGEKFFVCDWPGCTRSYTQNSHLRRHQLVHMEDKPFACDWPGCNYRSVRSCDVSNHKVTHTGEKKFLCEYPNCGKSFSRSHHLKRHLTIHSTGN